MFRPNARRITVAAHAKRAAVLASGNGNAHVYTSLI